MRFYVWSRDKAASNKAKHRVSFEVAVKVFDDPGVVTVLDRIEGGEYRWQSVGLVERALLLLVVHTEESEDDDELVRIISARPATRRERVRYERAIGSGDR